MEKTTTRRKFIKTVGAGTAVMSIDAASYARIPGANERIPIAIIGCGARGVGAHMKGVHPNAKSENIEVTAVCAPWNQRRQAAADLNKELHSHHPLANRGPGAGGPGGRKANSNQFNRRRIQETLENKGGIDESQVKGHFYKLRHLWHSGAVGAGLAHSAWRRSEILRLNFPEIIRRDFSSFSCQTDTIIPLCAKHTRNFPT